MNAVLLDTNLLVLLIIGLVDRHWIRRHKRSRAFDERDWHLLRDVLGDAALVTTPHILAETSNLLMSGGMTAQATNRLMVVLAELVTSAREEHMPAESVASTAFFRRLGLTDAAMISIRELNAHLLTTDLHLYLAALRQGRPVTNFNHLRDADG